MEARSKHGPLFTRRGALAMGAAVLSTAALVGIQETFAQGCLGIAGSGSAMPPAVVAAAERYLSERSSKLVATDLTGTSFTKIKGMVKRGLPVMVWSTIDAETPVYTSLRTDVEGYPWYRNFHCVVLYGVDGNDALASDPLEGLVRRDRAWFTILHRACGLMAASIDVAS